MDCCAFTVKDCGQIGENYLVTRDIGLFPLVMNGFVVHSR